ncbi:hypothetical protein ACP70R_008376 [Stipagrostis hirtigluma subsp. patula]
MLAACRSGLPSTVWSESRKLSPSSSSSSPVHRHRRRRTSCTSSHRMEPLGSFPTFGIRLDYRYSAIGFHTIVKGLSRKQQESVRSIGFGGLLEIPYISKVDRRLYAWLLSRIDVERMVLKVSDDHEVAVDAANVRRVLGIPCGNLSVYGSSTSDRKNSRRMVRQILGVKGTDPMPAIKDIENNLLESKKCSTPDEKQLFLCSFIILVAEMLLSPRQGFEKVPVNLCPGFANPLNSEQYDWCSYVVDELRYSSILVKQALASGMESISLHGCLVALQLIYMDSLPIARALVSESKLPRLALYTPSVISEIMKKDASENKLSEFRDFVERMSTSLPEGGGAHRKRSRRRGRSHGFVTRMLSRSIARNQKLGIHDLSAPLNVCDINIQDATQALQMIPYADPTECSRIYQYNSNNSSQDQNPMDDGGSNPTDNENSHPSPDTAMNDDCTSNCIEHMDKDIDIPNERAPESASEIGCLYNDIVGNEPEHGTALHGGIQLPRTFPSNIHDWSKDYMILWLPKCSVSPNFTRAIFPGCPFDPNNTSFAETILDAEAFAHWIQLNPAHIDYIRDWILHRQHRTVLLTGRVIRFEMFETLSIGRDICELATRVFRLSEVQRCSSDGFISRHFLSADWSNYIYNGIATTHETFFSNKCLTVVDPSITPATQQLVGKRHFWEAAKLHIDLIRCLQLYCGYDGIQTDRWVLRILSRVTEKPMSEQNCSTRSGLYALFCAVQFDGAGLLNAPTEELLLSFRNKLLYHILRLPENQGCLPDAFKQYASSI